MGRRGAADLLLAKEEIWGAGLDLARLQVAQGEGLCWCSCCWSPVGCGLVERGEEVGMPWLQVMVSLVVHGHQREDGGDCWSQGEVRLLHQ